MSKLDKFGEWKNPGKVFLTGASAGIGASYAKAFAENGFDLVLLYEEEVERDQRDLSFGGRKAL